MCLEKSKSAGSASQNRFGEKSPLFSCISWFNSLRPLRIKILHVLNGSIFTATPLGFWTRLPRCVRRNQREALPAYRIRRHRPRISASFSGTCCRKHSHAADIRYCLLADGLERINDSMLTSIPSRNTVFRFSGIPTPFQDVNDCAYHSTRSTRLSSSLFVYFVVQISASFAFFAATHQAD